MQYSNQKSGIGNFDDPLRFRDFRDSRLMSSKSLFVQYRMTIDADEGEGEFKA